MTKWRPKYAGVPLKHSLLVSTEWGGWRRTGVPRLVLTQEALSEAAGLSGVHVNRTLQMLRAQGLLSFGRERSPSIT